MRRSMLAADKQALESGLSQSMAQLQWKELGYLHANFQNLALSSSVLIGLGIMRGQVNFQNTSDMSHTIWNQDWATMSDYEKTGYVLDGLSCGFINIALCCNVVTLFLSTVTSMTGPGLALRGPEGSVSMAVMHMEVQNKRALRFFGRGLWSFMLYIFLISGRALFSIQFLGGVMGLFSTTGTLVLLLRYGSEIAERFYVSPDHLVRGNFTGGHVGSPQWLPSEDDDATRNSLASPCCTCCGWSPRWRPPKHGCTTPLWRLDKLIAFPWRQLETKGASPAVVFREQMHDLVMRQQHLQDPGTSQSTPDGQRLHHERDLIERLADFCAPGIQHSSSRMAPGALNLRGEDASEGGRNPNATPLLPV